jgi:uncharacterized protein YraI
MRLRSLLALAALGAGLAFAVPAQAQTVAYTAPGTSNVRAGAGLQYPVVGRLWGGTQVYVYGCVIDRSWCDIFGAGVRGWMHTSRLQFMYSGRLVPVPGYWNYFGPPIITFNFGYWDRYYRNQPWFFTWPRRPVPQPPRPPVWPYPPAQPGGPPTNYPGVEHPGSSQLGSPGFGSPGYSQ